MENSEENAALYIEFSMVSLFWVSHLISGSTAKEALQRLVRQSGPRHLVCLPTIAMFQLPVRWPPITYGERR